MGLCRCLTLLLGLFLFFFLSFLAAAAAVWIGGFGADVWFLLGVLLATVVVGVGVGGAIRVLFSRTQGGTRGDWR